MSKEQWEKVASIVLSAALAILAVLGWVVKPVVIEIEQQSSGGFSTQSLTGTGGDFDDITADSVDVSGDVTIGGTLSVTTWVTESTDLALTGDLAVGNGTPTIAQDGEDAYVEGQLEVDGEAQFDGAIDANGAVAIDGGQTNIGGATADVADGDNDLVVAGVLEVDGETELDGALDADSTANIQGMLTLQAGLTGALNVESVVYPSVLAVPITYTAAAGGSGVVATITDGEIWFVHKVFVRTTTSFACTGDDCTLVVGDGNDADGFLALADASMQSTFTEATGFAAGWAGIENGSAGAYTTDDGGPFVYAPSGADETIDWLLDETSDETYAAGAATIYVIYTRIQ
jgi:hypothetical protein